MAQRSLLNGQEDCVTFQMTMSKPFFAVSLIWNVLRKYCPEDMTQNIKGMRCYKDNTGAVFDVQANNVSRFEDIFEHETQRSTDFACSRATALPELKEDMATGGYGGGYGGGGGGYGGGGYGGGSYGGGGGY